MLTSKANFVRVEVDKQWEADVPHSVLLCNVKTLLKKMEQRVLVGDKVKIGSIDWQDGRGTDHYPCLFPMLPFLEVMLVI